MKRLALIGCALTFAWAPLHAGTLDRTLSKLLDETPDDAIVSALVYLQEQVDLDAFETGFTIEHVSRAVRHETVVTALNDVAFASQGDLLATLDAMAATRPWPSGAAPTRSPTCSSCSRHGDRAPDPKQADHQAAPRAASCR